MSLMFAHCLPCAWVSRSLPEELGESRCTVCSILYTPYFNIHCTIEAAALAKAEQPQVGAKKIPKIESRAKRTCTSRHCAKSLTCPLLRLQGLCSESWEGKIVLSKALASNES